MVFNKHPTLDGTHSFLSPSQYAWLNYDDEKFDQSVLNALATEKGTKLHALAAELITMGIRLPKTKQTLNMYVNDAIGYHMQPEVLLFYSDNCYGSADTINFSRNLLRIHDYKSGKRPASMNQLYIYSALFCLEYNRDIRNIDCELRIYQNNECLVDNPDPDHIIYIQEKIIERDRRINELNML